MNHTLKNRSTTHSSKLTRPLSRIGIVIAFLLISTHVYAAKPLVYTSFLNNQAVGGYDAVSYFQANGNPTKGKRAFKFKYKGADWYFVSQQNLDLFKKEPEKYAPQFGGYCAYALASNDTVKGDPLQYHIHDNKLYLNINAKYKKIWVADKLDYIAKGDANWPSALD